MSLYLVPRIVLKAHNTYLLNISYFITGCISFFLIFLVSWFIHALCACVPVGRERETSVWERNINQLPPIWALTRDWTHNLGMYPDQGSNLQTFWYTDNAPNNCTTPARAREKKPFIVSVASGNSPSSKAVSYSLVQGREGQGPWLRPAWGQRIPYTHD